MRLAGSSLLAVALLLVVALPARAADEDYVEEGKVEEYHAPMIGVDDEVIQNGGELEALCGGPNAKIQIGDGGAAFPSFPCETVRTDVALARIQDRTGFMATSTRFFLRSRLFMRGLGSVVFGFFGLG